MAELTIAIHAGHGPSLGISIASLLREDGIDHEVMVICDGVADGLALCSLRDPRVTLIHINPRDSEGYGYNAAFARSHAPYFAVLRADCVVRPGGLRKLLDACEISANTAMAYGNFFEVDADNRAIRDNFRTQIEIFSQIQTAKPQNCQTLLRHGELARRFCVFQRATVEAAGRFNERPLVEPIFDMALRIADRYTVGIVADFCYTRRRRSPSSTRWQRLGAWARRAIHYHRLADHGGLSYRASTVRRLLLKELCAQSGTTWLTRQISDYFEGWYWRCRIGVESRLYSLFVGAIAQRPLAFAPTTGANSNHRRIAYYTWHFPVLSQTFINRELAALKNAGVAVEVIADEPEAVELADENAKALLDHTHYLEPIDAGRLRAFHRHFFRVSPLEYIKTFCFIISRQYGSYKTIQEDIAVFSRAIYLAGVALDKQVDHLHAPWSDRCAFVAMVAARLAGITYSVQARAHDIHRDGYLFALADKFEPAQFIVTNTRYNETYMKTFLGRADWPKLHVIHNGLDLQRFVPATRPKSSPAAITLLCVARLIEQKGLTYLLRTCAALREQGFALDCEIVGGTEDIFMNYYLDFKRLRKQLNLEAIVRLTGSLPFKEVLERYRQADIFVLPCVIAADGSRDITPNALIEAMAMKLPVVSTTVTGVPEIVEHGVSGILVPPNDAEALTEAIGVLIRNPDLRETLGEQARKKVEEKFDINKNVTQYIKLFTGANQQNSQTALVDHNRQAVLLQMKGHHA